MVATAAMGWEVEVGWALMGAAGSSQSQEEAAAAVPACRITKSEVIQQTPPTALKGAPTRCGRATQAGCQPRTVGEVLGWAAGATEAAAKAEVAREGVATEAAGREGVATEAVGWEAVDYLAAAEMPPAACQL